MESSLHLYCYSYSYLIALTWRPFRICDCRTVLDRRSAVGAIKCNKDT